MIETLEGLEPVQLQSIIGNRRLCDVIGQARIREKGYAYLIGAQLLDGCEEFAHKHYASIARAAAKEFLPPASLATLRMAVEELLIGLLCYGSISDHDYRALVGPVARVCLPWALTEDLSHERVKAEVEKADGPRLWAAPLAQTAVEARKPEGPPRQSGFDFKPRAERLEPQETYDAESEARQLAKMMLDSTSPEMPTGTKTFRFESL